MERLLQLLENPYLKASLVVLAGIVGARVAAFITTKVLGALTAKTKTTADDEVLRVIRGPLIVSIILVSISIASHIVPTPESLERHIKAVLMTIGILAWSRASLKVASVLLQLLSRKARTSDLIQPRTLPVFDIFGKVVVSSLAVYFIFLAWDIDLTAWLASAGIAGIAIPLGLKRLGIDPALSGSVVLTTVTDVIGFMAFLGLATLFYL